MNVKLEHRSGQPFITSLLGCFVDFGACYAKNDFALSYPVEHSVLPQATPGTL